MSAQSSDDSNSSSSGRYSEDEMSQGPASYAASQACGMSDKMLSHLGITPKVAPAYDGTTSWFEYEQLIDDWCDITRLDESKRGVSQNEALRSCKPAKKTLDRTTLTAADGVEHFNRKLRPYFVKDEQYIFVWRFLGVFKAWKGNQDFVTRIAQFDIVLQRLRNSWMDFLPGVALADGPPEFANALRQDATFMRLQDATEQATYAERQFREWNCAREDAHRRSCPLDDNLLSLLFLVQSQLNDNQKERLVSTLTNRQRYRIETYSYTVVRQTMFERFATTRTALQVPNIRRSAHKQDRRARRDMLCKRGGRKLPLDQGEYDGAEG